MIAEQPRLLRRSSPVASRCPRCRRTFPDRDYATGKPIERCRCGAKRPAETLEDHGYTTRHALAMPSEPEAIPAAVQERYSTEARERDQAKLEELRQRALAATAELELCAKDARTKKRLRAARKQLSDAMSERGKP